MECVPCVKLHKTLYTTRDSAPSASGQKIEISTSSANAESSWILSVTLCFHKFEWLIDFEPYLDVSPLLHSFKDSLVSPFDGMDEVIKTLKESQATQTTPMATDEKIGLCNRIAHVLCNEIVKKQRQSIKALKILSAELDFVVELLEVIQGSTMYLGPRNSDNQCILSVDFPLLPYLNSTTDANVKPMISYLDAVLNHTHSENSLQITESQSRFDAVRMCRNILISIDRKSVVKVEDKLTIPSSGFPASGHLDAGSYTTPSRKPFVSSFVVDIAGASSSSNTHSSGLNSIAALKLNESPDKNASLHDVCIHLATAMSSKWTDRREFIQQLACISAVLEFDPIDFAYVVIAMRLKQEQMCTVCTVEMRIPIGFPEISMPLMSLHDMQTGHSSLLEMNTLMQLASAHKDPVTNVFDIAKIAEECFRFARDFIRRHAFDHR